MSARQNVLCAICPWENRWQGCRWSLGHLGWKALMRVHSDWQYRMPCWSPARWGQHRAANASDFIVNLPILWPSLRLYDCNGKSTIFMLANYLTYTLYVTLTLPLASLQFPPLYKAFINIDTWRQILMTPLYKGGSRKDASHGVGSDEIYLSIYQLI